MSWCRMHRAPRALRSLQWTATQQHHRLASHNIKAFPLSFNTSQSRPGRLFSSAISRHRPNDTKNYFNHKDHDRNGGPNHGNVPPQPPRPSRQKWYLRGVPHVVIAVILVELYEYFTGQPSILTTLFEGQPKPPLHPDFFTPYTITAKEPLSPTAFVLTVQPTKAPRSKSGKDAMDALWARQRGSTWSVEIKQPQLQIARDYTPLPPLGEAAANGELRFMIRSVQGGEVSNYLSRLAVGDGVELRGPHPGFDVRRRLGSRGGQVMFLAGGTGIAPALQVAEAVLGGDGEGAADEGAGVTILWANRSRADCVGCDSGPWKTEGSKGREGADLGNDGGAIMKQLWAMKRRYGERLRVRCFVDEERTFIKDKEVLGALKTPTTPSLDVGKSLTLEKGCPYHSSKRLEALSADPAPGAAKNVPKACECGSTGANLVIVSGPDGFVTALAGRKKWERGEERQGAVDGVLGRIKAKYPDLLRDWQVLKL